MKQLKSARHASFNKAEMDFKRRGQQMTVTRYDEHLSAIKIQRTARRALARIRERQHDLWRGARRRLVKNADAHINGIGVVQSVALRAKSFLKVQKKLVGDQMKYEALRRVEEDYTQIGHGIDTSVMLTAEDVQLNVVYLNRLHQRQRGLSVFIY